MDAISLLEEDHRKMKELLSELESTTERGVKTREELFATVKEELTVHETSTRPSRSTRRPRRSPSRRTRSTTWSTW